MEADRPGQARDRPGPPAPGGRRGRRDDPRVVGQAEVIVRGEQDGSRAVDQNLGGRGGVQRGRRPKQPGRFQRRSSPRMKARVPSRLTTSGHRVDRSGRRRDQGLRIGRRRSPAAASSRGRRRAGGSAAPSLVPRGRRGPTCSAGVGTGPCSPCRRPARSRRSGRAGGRRRRAGSSREAAQASRQAGDLRRQVVEGSLLVEDPRLARATAAPSGLPRRCGRGRRSSPRGRSRRRRE